MFLCQVGKLTVKEISVLEVIRKHMTVQQWTMTRCCHKTVIQRAYQVFASNSLPFSCSHQREDYGKFPVLLVFNDYKYHKRWKLTSKYMHIQVFFMFKNNFILKCLHANNLKFIYLNCWCNRKYELYYKKNLKLCTQRLVAM